MIEDHRTIDRDHGTMGFQEARRCRRPCSRTVMARFSAWQVLRHRGRIGWPRHRDEPFYGDRRD